MACARCGKCDLDLPADRKRCPVCKGDLNPVRWWNHDPEWKEKARRLLNRHVPGTPIPDANVPLVRKNGHCFVANDLLEDAGYHSLDTGSIILIRGEYWEIIGPMRDDDFLAWFVEHVDPEMEFADLPITSKKDSR